MSVKVDVEFYYQFLSIIVDQLLLDMAHCRGGGVKAKTKKSVVLQQIIIQKALSQKRKVGGGGGGGV